MRAHLPFFRGRSLKSRCPCVFFLFFVSPPSRCASYILSMGRKYNNRLSGEEEKRKRKEAHSTHRPGEGRRKEGGDKGKL